MQQNSAAYTKDLVTTGTGLPGGISVPNDAMNLSGAFLDDIQVDFLLRATQAHQSAHLLTAPRLTLYNGQRAYVTVTDQRTYISKLTQTVTPVSGTNVTGFTTEIDYESSTVTTGVLLDVEATISADRRYVTLTLRPQVSELVNMETVVFDSGGGDTSGQGSGFLEVQLPEVSLQEIQTTVSVPDGGTLLIGGQKLAREKEKEIGVPMLDKVPILNRAFTNRTKVRDDQTLLILVRPKIIIQHEAEQLAEEHGGGINP
jgi:type II secretory pathway component GspD/PulD (secretin)